MSPLDSFNRNLDDLYANTVDEIDENEYVDEDVKNFEINKIHSDNRREILECFFKDKDTLLKMGNINLMLSSAIYPMCQEGAKIDKRETDFRNKILDEILKEVKSIKSIKDYDKEDFIEEIEKTKFSKMNYKTVDRLRISFSAIIFNPEEEYSNENGDEEDYEDNNEYSFEQSTDKPKMNNDKLDDEKKSFSGPDSFVEYMMRANDPKEVLGQLKKAMENEQSFKYKDYILNLKEDDLNLSKNKKLYAISFFQSAMHDYTLFTPENKKITKDKLKRIESLIDSGTENKMDLSEIVKLSFEITISSVRDINHIKNRLEIEKDKDQQKALKERLASVRLEKYGQVNLKDLNSIGNTNFSESQYLRSREMRYLFEDGNIEQPLLNIMLKSIDVVYTDIELVPESNVIAHLIEFQKKHGLRPDGLFGPRTYAKIIELGGKNIRFKGNEKNRRTYHK